ncbi:MAG: DUF211 domain-containing protein [Thaumarchaeota archaeon]|nr:DUF211 domain-containing protein [Nitrososphaerota archaeon]
MYIKRLVIDALKPREVSIMDLSKSICELDGVEEVSVIVTEVDVKTETVKIMISGNDIDFDKMMDAISDSGVSVRSIDEVSLSRIRPSSS